jgi:predicted bacteriocin transport accessory protein
MFKIFKRKEKKNNTGLYAILGLVFIIGFSILVSNLTGPEEAKLPVFKTITYAEYEQLFDDTKKGLVFVYVGRPTCSYCVKIQPLLKTLEEEENMVFNYLNTDEMTAEEINTKISTTTAAFAGEWGTPTLLAIIDGKEHSNVNGYRELEELRTFVKAAKSAIGNE